MEARQESQETQTEVGRAGATGQQQQPTRKMGGKQTCSSRRQVWERGHWSRPGTRQGNSNWLSDFFHAGNKNWLAGLRDSHWDWRLGDPRGPHKTHAAGSYALWEAHSCAQEHTEGSRRDHSLLAIFSGDCQEHQVPWCSHSGEPHLDPEHQFHHQESPATSLLPSEAEGSPSLILTTFYRGTVESILSSCIITWFGNCTAFDRKTLQRIVRTAEKIIGVSLPSITNIYITRCIRKATNIMKDPTHPSHELFTLLPSGRRYRSIQSRTSRLCNSFFPEAIRLLNSG
ncbi:hypothetical protein P4O66_009241 [Electrophorus voltai]|uniref:Uncharacterized protein n=1 Tax=Electrophorus voltai TaxID=2609070 RepID=A0AAD9DWW4_9TELE|nr:hypothetical protein P4O66_009241 [Electrophorus voltai]